MYVCKQFLHTIEAKVVLIKNRLSYFKRLIKILRVTPKKITKKYTERKMRKESKCYNKKIKHKGKK